MRFIALVLQSNFFASCLMLWYSLEDTFTISQEVILFLVFILQRYFKEFYTLALIRLVVETPAPGVNASLSYYKDLGFQSTKWRKAYLCQVKNLTIFLNPDPYSHPWINLFGAQEDKTTVSPSDTWVKERKENIKYSTSDTNGLLGNYAFSLCRNTWSRSLFLLFGKPKDSRDNWILTQVGASLKIKMETVLACSRQTLAHIF